MEVQPRADDAFRLGFVTGLTSPYAAVALNQSKGAELAVAEINAVGGINGRRIELILKDDHMDEEHAALVAREFIEKDKVHAIAGTISAATQLVFNKVARAAGIPFMSCSQSNKITTAEHRGPLTFHEAFTPFTVGQMLVQWGVPSFGKRWVFLMPDYAWGRESYESSASILKEMGGTDAGMIKIRFGATVEEYEATFKEILALKPDVLSVRNLGADQVNFVKAAAKAGLKKEFPIFLGIAETMIIHDVSLEELVGLYWGVNFYWGLESRIPSAKRFVDAFRARFNNELPTGYSGYAYAGVKELLLALAEGGYDGTSYDGIPTFLEGRHYDHYKGPQWWRPCDHQSFQDFYILRFKGPEESTERYDIAEIIDTVPWDLSTERTCKELGFPR